MIKDRLYPLKFKPILKERIWGGKKLNLILNKSSTKNNIGESWEISTVNNNISVVNNGSLKGINLLELLKTYTHQLVGKKTYAQFKDQFPLLIKFIDAKDDLSVQVHPDDFTAQNRHNSFGKSEMWYVLQAEADANLIIGFNKKLNSHSFKEHLKNKSLLSTLAFKPVTAGDSFFIKAGTIHAIGAGVLLAEIQQNSDITYRIYDWDRVDNNGKERELHTDLAVDSIFFNNTNYNKAPYANQPNAANHIITCNYFKTNYLHITQTNNKQNNYDSFIIYICIGGQAEIITDTYTEIIKKGETILIPATIEFFSINAEDAKLLEVFIP